MSATRVLIALAEAVTARINAGSAARAFSQNVTATRQYDTERQLETLDGICCDVVIGDLDDEAANRNEMQYSGRIDVALRKKLQGTTETARIAETDALVLLLDEIRGYLADPTVPRPFPEYPAATWQSSKVRLSFSPRRWRRNDEYFGLFAVTYEVIA